MAVGTSHLSREAVLQLWELELSLGAGAAGRNDSGRFEGSGLVRLRWAGIRKRSVTQESSTVSQLLWRLNFEGRMSLWKSFAFQTQGFNPQLARGQK